MAVAARKANWVDTFPATAPGELGGSADPFSVQDGERAHETVRMLREILAGQGLRESLGTDDEGFYFVAEDAAEISIYYNTVEPGRDDGRGRAPAGEAGLLTCCHALARRGFTLTLFLSGRTSALFVRNGW
jgi:hypothetical protein